jgi:hypothetical protein
VKCSVLIFGAVEENAVTCKSCQKDNHGSFGGEVAIRYAGLEGPDKLIVWVFPRILVCLECGVAEFHIPGEELRKLAKADAAAAG